MCTHPRTSLELELWWNVPPAYSCKRADIVLWCLSVVLTYFSVLVILTWHISASLSLQGVRLEVFRMFWHHGIHSSVSWSLFQRRRRYHGVHYVPFHVQVSLVLHVCQCVVQTIHSINFKKVTHADGPVKKDIKVLSGLLFKLEDLVMYILTWIGVTILLWSFTIVI